MAKDDKEKIEEKVEPETIPEVETPKPPKNVEKPTPVTAKEEMIEVPKTMLDRLLKRMETVEEDNKLLKEVADKDKIARIMTLRSGGKLIKTVNLSTISNKVVIGWSKVKDDVYFDEQGRLHEDQRLSVIYEGGEKVEMDYRQFSRVKSPIKAEILSETKDNDGNTNLKVLLPDGKEINIDIKFVN